YCTSAAALRRCAVRLTRSWKQTGRSGPGLDRLAVDPMVIARGAEPRRSAGELQLGDGTLGAAHAVDEQPHRSRIEVACARVVAELVGCAARVERVLPERARRDESRECARDRHQI